MDYRSNMRKELAINRGMNNQLGQAILIVAKRQKRLWYVVGTLSVLVFALATKLAGWW